MFTSLGLGGHLNDLGPVLFGRPGGERQSCNPTLFQPFPLLLSLSHRLHPGPSHLFLAIVDLDICIVEAGNAALDEDQVEGGIDADDGQVLHGRSGRTHMTRHLLSRDDSTGVLKAERWSGSAVVRYEDEMHVLIGDSPGVDPYYPHFDASVTHRASPSIRGSHVASSHQRIPFRYYIMTEDKIRSDKAPCRPVRGHPESSDLRITRNVDVLSGNKVCCTQGRPDGQDGVLGHSEFDNLPLGGYLGFCELSTELRG